MSNTFFEGNDERVLNYLRYAYSHASQESTDPSTQNAALLVNDTGGIVCFGANHFPRGVIESPERWERPAKYQYVEHAERNAIYTAARMGWKTQGLTMICPWFACADCARAIIQVGITEVIGHDFELHSTSASWKQSIEVAYKMLIEAGVKFRHVKGICGERIRFNGSVVDV